MATNFDLTSILNHKNSVVTRQGNPVKIITITNDKIFASVYPANRLSKIPTTYKYNMDGTLYSKDYEHPLDLIMVA